MLGFMLEHLRHIRRLLGKFYYIWGITCRRIHWVYTN